VAQRTGTAAAPAEQSALTLGLDATSAVDIAMACEPSDIALLTPAGEPTAREHPIVSAQILQSIPALVQISMLAFPTRTDRRL
jgi:hypothetical protein